MVAFFVSMEWTGQQQIQFLLQSFLLGALQGVLLDVVTGWIAFSGHRRWLWTDVAFGPIAAIITFLGTLVISDGHLHPLLLFGVLVGMVIEHIVVGAKLTRLIRRIRRRISRVGEVLSNVLCRFMRSVVIRSTFWMRNTAKSEEKP